MTYVYILLACAGAFAIGYMFGERRGVREGHMFSEPSVARSMGERGAEEVQARIERRKERILARAERKGSITNDDVEDLFCISDTTARRYLEELQDDGRLTETGSERPARYVTTVI